MFPGGDSPNGVRRSDYAPRHDPCMGQAHHAAHAAMKICVLTVGGKRGDEPPHAFYVGGRRLLVAGLIGRWHDTTYRHFEVRVEDGRRFVLRQDIAARDWELAGVYGASRGR
jgi:hypothetical protein